VRKGRKARTQLAEGRGQRAEGRGQRAEGRGQRAENGGALSSAICPLPSALLLAISSLPSEEKRG
jgi:hypothetical protein